MSPRGDSIYVTGESFEQTTRSVDIATAAFSTEDGSLTWAARRGMAFPEGMDSRSVGNTIALDPAGERLFVSGWISAIGSNPGQERSWNDVMLAYDSTDGDLLWEVSSPDRPGLRFEPLAISAGSSVVVVVGAWINDATELHEGSGLFAFKASDGSLLWSKTHPRGQYAESLLLTPDENSILVAGYVNDEAASKPRRSWLIHAYDLRTGKLQWTTRSEVSRIPSDLDPVSLKGRPTDQVLSPNGAALFVIGSREKAGKGRIRVAAFQTSNGRKLWSRTLEPRRKDLSPILETFHTIELRRGRVLATANFANPSSHFRHVSAALIAENGRALWTSIPIDGVSWSTTLAGDSQGTLISAGLVKPDKASELALGIPAHPQGRIDCITSAIDVSDGSIRWIARYESPQAPRGGNCIMSHYMRNDIVALANDDMAFVAGSVQHGDVNGVTPPWLANTYDYLILGYNLNN